MVVRRYLGLAWVVAVLSGLALTGCGTSVSLDRGAYTPKVGASEFQVLRGKAVNMPGFSNRDNDTTIFYYFSLDKDRKYGGPPLTSFFWYAFQEAFENIGVSASDGTAPVGSPKLEIDLVRINEQHFEIEAKLTPANGAIYRKTYQIAGPPTSSHDDRALETRAYHMVDLLFSEMVSDPGFQAAMLGSATVQVLPGSTHVTPPAQAAPAAVK